MIPFLNSVDDKDKNRGGRGHQRDDGYLKVFLHLLGGSCSCSCQDKIFTFTGGLLLLLLPRQDVM